MPGAECLLWWAARGSISGRCAERSSMARGRAQASERVSRRRGRGGGGAGGAPPPPPAGLRGERTALYRRITDRVDRMGASGLVEEVDRLLKAGYPPHLKPLRSHNYRPMVAYLLGQQGWEEAVRRTKQETRHYAKRQMTWFRSEDEITWFDVTDNDPDRITELLIEHIQRRRARHGTAND